MCYTMIVKTIKSKGAVMFRRKTMQEAKQETEKIFEILKAITCCFTGYRSQKLPWRFNELDERCLIMKENARNEILNAIKIGYRTFISGMALGFDMICAEIILELKKQYQDIKLVCALPCKDQYKVWREDQQKRYKDILKQADIVHYQYEKYQDGCMLERNDYMLNNSSMVIALFNGQPGGTKYTLDKAQKKGLKIVVIKP